MGNNWELATKQHAQGREYYWYNYPDGATVNGHDNVVWAQHYDADVSGDVLLVKRNPVSGEFSAVRTNNSGVDGYQPDGRGSLFHTSSVEKFYGADIGNTPLEQLFDTTKLRPTAIRYEVTKGSQTIPSDTTYTLYDKPQVYTIDGDKIFPKSYIEYHDGTGRIDWHQDWPYESVITEYPQAREENNVRYRVSVPQSIPGSNRLFRLTEDGKPDGITDVFAPTNPLQLDFGKGAGKTQALQVDRLGDRDVYHMVDGSAYAVAHDDGKMTRVHFENGKPDMSDIKQFKGTEGYTETYSKPWGTIFGQAKEVTISPKQAKYELVNGGDVVHFKTPSKVEGFDNVDWVYTDPNGDRVMQLADGAQTRVKFPLGGAKTGVAGMEVAEGVQVIPGPGGFQRFWFQQGDSMVPMDVIPDRPGVGLIRRPGEIMEVSATPEGWRSITTVFEKDQLPVVYVDDNGVAQEPKTIPLSRCVDANGNPKPINQETFKTGLMTKWGLALERVTYPSGTTELKIATSADTTAYVEIDVNGNKVVRNAAGKITKLVPEPKDYPRLNDVKPIRRIVNAKDFPDVSQPAADVAPPPEDEVGGDEGTTDAPHHDDLDDTDKLDTDE